MTTTTVQPDVQLSEFEAACIDTYALILLEDAHDQAHTAEGRANIQRLLNLIDGAGQRRVKPDDLVPFADFFDREASVIDVERDEAGLAHLLETGDTSDFWPSQTLAENIRSQRLNLENSRRCFKEATTVIGVIGRCRRVEA